MVAPATAAVTRRAPLAHRRARTFDEERDACRPDVRLRGDPASILGALRGADGGVRRDVVGQLQRQAGNASVQGLLGAGGPGAGAIGGLAVQRWAVKVAPGTTDCMVVVNWMNAHSPYRETTGWAQTTANFDWTGPLEFDGEGSDLTVRVKNPAVTMTKSVDMPTWAPSHPSMRAAWSAMTSDLRAHEARHEAIADRWKGTLTERLKALRLSVTSRRAGERAVDDEWKGWLREHQDEQKSIDPFTAMLDCSAAVEHSAGESPEAVGEAAAAGGEE
jgi:predicted secreted Zn-dependent protease